MAYLSRCAVVSASPGAAADTAIVAAVPNARIYVNSFWLVVSAAGTHARFRSGTNEIFTGAGGAIGLPLAPNGGLVVPEVSDDPNVYLFRTGVNEALNLRTEVAVEFTVGVSFEVRS